MGEPIRVLAPGAAARTVFMYTRLTVIGGAGNVVAKAVMLSPTGNSGITATFQRRLRC